MQLAGRLLRMTCIAVCDAEVWNDAFVLAAVRQESGEGFHQCQGHADERRGRFRREVRGLGEASDRAQAEVEGGRASQHAPRAFEHVARDQRRVHERHQHGDVRRNTERRVGVVAPAQVARDSFGSRDFHDERGDGHRAEDSWQVYGAATALASFAAIQPCSTRPCVFTKSTSSRPAFSDTTPSTSPRTT